LLIKYRLDIRNYWHGNIAWEVVKYDDQR
jgi:hypothetical protein